MRGRKQKEMCVAKYEMKRRRNVSKNDRKEKEKKGIDKEIERMKEKKD